MIGEIHSLLALEPADLKATQDAEREVATLMVRCRSAARSVADAEMALEVANQLLARVTVEARLGTEQARALAQAIIEKVDSRPQVRPMYKAGLRDIFGGTKSESKARDDGGAPSLMPYALKVSADKDHTVLKWLWQGAWSETLRFEVAAAVGTTSVYRGTATASDGKDFVILGTTEPGAEMSLRFQLAGTPDHPVKDGTPLVYRVRALTVNGAVGEWSEPLRVANAVPRESTETAPAEKTRRNALAALFEIGSPRARG